MPMICMCALGAAMTDYQPMPPYVSPDYMQQRYFSRSESTNAAFEIQLGKPNYFGDGKFLFASGCVQVLRFSEDNHANVEFTLEIQEINRNCRNRSTTSLDCTASQLREIAYRLLDAASDIDTNPAHKIAKTRQVKKSKREIA